MKKTISLILALSFLCGCLAFTACSGKNPETETNSSGLGASQVVDKASADVQINQVVKPEKMSTKELPKPRTEIHSSWKDEDGNQYYILYLGRIDSMEVCNIQSFQYKNDVEKIKITTTDIDEETITTQHRSQITKVTSWNSTAYVKDTLKIKAEAAYGPFSAGVENAFETGFTQSYGGSDTSFEDDFYENVTRKVRTVCVEKTLDCSKACTYGKWYRYSACADFHCYMNLYIPLGGAATYNFSTQMIEGTVFDILLEKDSKNDFTGIEDVFTLDSIGIDSLQEPTEVVNMHEDLTLRAVKYETITVKKGNRSGVNADITKIYDEAVAKGKYNKVEVTASYDISGSFGNIDTYLGYAFHPNDTFAKDTWSANIFGGGSRHASISGTCDLKYFFTNKKVHLFFESLWGNYDGYKVSNIEITVRIYVG